MSKLRTINGGPSRDVLRMRNQVIGMLRKQDIRGIAVVIVKPCGEVGTAFSGHKDGCFHQLNSGISILRQRFDKESA